MGGTWSTAERLPMQGQELRQLGEWGRIIIDTQVDGAIAVAPKAAAGPFDQQRSGLLATTVPAGCLSGIEHGNQTFGEGDRRMAFERRRHRGNDRLAGKDVSLTTEVFTDDMSGPRGALATRKCGGAPRAVDHADLTHVTSGIASNQPRDHLVRAQALREHGEAERSVSRVRHSLRGHRSNAAFGPWDKATDGQEARLHRNTP
jgi:hypothetical protein